ncbi:MAG TPA: (2Fe-2S)-binding protein [Acidimicrobiales bacterium]|nr:(2Fe-2S)-binding protein [Acidimicrobiales bacterium]
MMVCSCKVVSDRTVRAAIAAGASTVDEVTDRCRAGGGCGGCHALLEQMLAATDPARQLVSSSAA